MATVIIDIAAGANDGYYLTSVSTWYGTETTMRTGSAGGGHYYHTSLRFLSVSIPKGARINSATVRITASDSNATVADITIKGDDVDSSGALSGTHCAGNGFVDTAASVAWGISGQTQYSNYTSPDISSIIQEIVDRSGWASGNNLSLGLYGSAYASGIHWWFAYEYGTSSYYARLTIDYTLYDSVSESVGVTDGLSVKKTLRSSVADSVGASDAILRRISAKRSLSEQFSIIDPAFQRQHLSPVYETSPFYLFELMFGAGTLRHSDTDVSLVWSGNLYTPIPIEIGGFGKSSTNFSETLTLATHNVDRISAGIILAEDIRGRPANIYRSSWVSANSYSPPVLVFAGQFDGVAVSEGTDSADVTMEIKNDFVRWEMSVPRHSFAGTCQWKFKSTTPGCQYTGAASLCNKTWERCEELANVSRFRGFRWLPMLQDKEIVWGKGPNPEWSGPRFRFGWPGGRG